MRRNFAIAVALVCAFVAMFSACSNEDSIAESEGLPPAEQEMLNITFHDDLQENMTANGIEPVSDANVSSYSGTRADDDVWLYSTCTMTSTLRTVTKMLS